MSKLVKLSQQAVLMATLLILSGCVTPVSPTQKVLDLDILANQAYRENRCDEAIELYSKLAKQLPKNTQSLLRIGKGQKDTPVAQCSSTVNDVGKCQSIVMDARLPLIIRLISVQCAECSPPTSISIFRLN